MQRSTDAERVLDLLYRRQFDEIEGGGPENLAGLIELLGCNYRQCGALVGKIGREGVTDVLLAALKKQLAAGPNNEGTRGILIGLAETGDPKAVGGLLSATKSMYIAQDAVSALQCTLERAATKVSSDDLKSVVSLGPVAQYEHQSLGPADSYEWARQLDTSDVVSLARAELRRRGIPDLGGM